MGEQPEQRHPNPNRYKSIRDWETAEQRLDLPQIVVHRIHQDL